MDLDGLKNDWQKQQAPEQLEGATADSLYQQYVKLNKKMMRSNILTSIAMLLTMFFIAWVWWKYHDNQGWAFTGSIISIEVLIVLVSGVFWSRVMQEQQMNMNKDMKSFLKVAIGKLKRTVYITKKIMPIYAVLLNLSLVLYFYDLMKHKLSWFFIATAVTTAYIIGMSVIGFKRHRKKQRKEVEPLIAEIEAVLRSVEVK